MSNIARLIITVNNFHTGSRHVYEEVDFYSLFFIVMYVVILTSIIAPRVNLPDMRLYPSNNKVCV